MEVYKSAGDYIVKLKFLKDTKSNLSRENVVDKNYAKFRCNKALVVSIKHKENSSQLYIISSNFSKSFVYTVGQIIEVKDYDERINFLCSKGIHFYLSEEAAYFHKLKPRNGLFKSWYDNGQLEKEFIYKNGEVDGELRIWYKNGQLSRESWYKEGYLKRSQVWNKEGELSVSQLNIFK